MSTTTKMGTWQSDGKMWLCGCPVGVRSTPPDTLYCGACNVRRPLIKDLNLPHFKYGTWIDSNYWRCECSAGTRTRGQTMCSGCKLFSPKQAYPVVMDSLRAGYGGLAATTTSTPADCNTCWGTGFYHGHGAPCSEGCSVPAAKVGLHVDAEVIELMPPLKYPGEVRQAMDRTKRQIADSMSVPALKQRGGPPVCIGLRVKAINLDHGGVGEGIVTHMGPDTPKGVGDHGILGRDTFWIKNDKGVTQPCDPDWNVWWEIVT